MKNKQRKKIALILLFILGCNVVSQTRIQAMAIPATVKALYVATNAAAMIFAAYQHANHSQMMSQLKTQLQGHNYAPLANLQTLDHTTKPSAPNQSHKHTYREPFCVATTYTQKTRTQHQQRPMPTAEISANNPTSHIVNASLKSVSADVTRKLRQQSRTVVIPYTENPGVTYTHTRTANSGTTHMHFANGQSAFFSVHAQPADKSARIRQQIAQQKAFESRVTLERMRVDQDYRHNVIERLNIISDCLRKTLSTDPIECTIARLQLADISIFSMEEPFQSELYKGIDGILRRIFNNKGELISLRKERIIRPFIYDISKALTELTGHDPRLRVAQVDPGEKIGITKGFLNYIFDAHKGGALKDNIKTNPVNAAIKQCIEAGLEGDLDTIKKIALKHNNNQIMLRLHDSFHDKFFDNNGIYRVCAKDPLYTNMPGREKTRLYKDVRMQKNLNETLLLRHSIKKTFQKAWNIPDTAPREVHNALYNIMGADGASLQNISAMIDAVVDAAHEKPTVQKAFFLPNGVMKDFCKYPRAKSLQLSPDIFAHEHKPDLLRLNHLLYIEHAFSDQAMGQHATQCIDYLEAYINTESPVLKQSYGALYRATYSSVVTQEVQLASQLPNLAVAYDDPAQADVHHNIVNAAALCIEVPSKVVLPQGPTLFDNYVDIVQEAHILNQMGFPDQAQQLLQKKFYDQVWDHANEVLAASDQDIPLYSFSAGAIERLVNACNVAIPEPEVEHGPCLPEMNPEEPEDRPACVQSPPEPEEGGPCVPSISTDRTPEPGICLPGMDTANPEKVGQCNHSKQKLPSMVDKAGTSSPMPQPPKESESEKSENIIKTASESPKSETGVNGDSAAETKTKQKSKSLPYERPIYQILEDTGEKVRIVRPVKEDEAWIWAPEPYEKIRQCSDDVEKIAKNTSWPKHKIEQIKKHLFHDEHILTKEGKESIDLLDADPEIAAAWNRLYHGDFIQNDIQLLEHEYHELQYEQTFKVNNKKAHNETIKQGYKWDPPKFKEN